MKSRVSGTHAQGTKFRRFFGEKSDVGGHGKEKAVENSGGRKSEKNRYFSAIFRRFFGTARFIQHFSGRGLHARAGASGADFIGDKSAINAKYRCFLGDFSGIYRAFFWPLDFFQLLI